MPYNELGILWEKDAEGKIFYPVTDEPQMAGPTDRRDMYSKLYTDENYGLIVKDISAFPIQRPPERWFPKENEYFSDVPLDSTVCNNGECIQNESDISNNKISDMVVETKHNYTRLAKALGKGRDEMSSENRYVPRGASSINQQSLPIPKIRKSWNIYDDAWDKVWRGISKEIGNSWDRIAFAALKKDPSKDYILTEQYACTLFDNETILVFDRAKEKAPEPETWNEEDLVISGLK